MARYLLDTGIVIRHLRGQQNVVQLLRGLGKRERLGIASITRLEIHVGMHPDEAYKTQKLLTRFITYDLSRDIADRAGDYIREYQAKQLAFSVPDALIAATAVIHQATLVTLNEKDFFAVPGLSLYPLPSEFTA
jgi:predicted nucleic acid-binding protein